MKVLNVQLKHIHGGNPQVCLDYTRALKSAGNDVTVLTNPLDPFLDKLAATEAKVIKSEKLGKLGSWDIFSILYFKKIIRQEKPDVIIVHEGRSAALMKRAAGSSIPVIDVNHGRSPKQSQAMDATIVTNSFRLKSNKDFLGEAHPVFYVPNSMYLKDHVKPQIPRERNNPPVIGTIGRLVSDKALDIFVEALAIIDKRGVEFTVKMAGEGEERASLTAQIAKHRLQDKIEMPGWVTDTDAFYKTIDIFCFPSRKEEFGLVLLEAYKHGLPAVVSDADGPADIAENDKDALVVPKENPEKLADALQMALENKEKADKLAQGGYDKLIATYDVPRVGEKLQGVLEEVVKLQNKVAA